MIEQVYLADPVPTTHAALALANGAEEVTCESCRNPAVYYCPRALLSKGMRVFARCYCCGEITLVAQKNLLSELSDVS